MLLFLLLAVVIGSARVGWDAGEPEPPVSANERSLGEPALPLQGSRAPARRSGRWRRRLRRAVLDDADALLEGHRRRRRRWG